MFTVSIINYSVNKLESQWGWSSHVTLRYLQLHLIVRFTTSFSKTSTGLPLTATTVCSPMSPVVPVHQESSKNDISLRQSSSQVIKILKVLKYGVLTSLRRGVQHTCWAKSTTRSRRIRYFIVYLNVQTEIWGVCLPPESLHSTLSVGHRNLQ